MMHNGFDGSAEEMHFVGAAALVERGYHVLTFDGPGQPGPMHREGLVFRPDWENVVGPVLDHLLTLPRSIRSASRCWATAWEACWRRARRRSTPGSRRSSPSTASTTWA
ncbi:hypothetical protein ACFQX6_23300 [Streptosporangium lutulentum]